MHSLRPTWCRVGGVLVSLMLATSPLAPSVAWAASSSVDKAETVHVDLDAMGNVNQVRVEDLLANDDHAPEVNDRSNLTDIEPNNEEQSYRKQKDGTLVWTTDGDEVGYKGTSSQEPPIRVKVTYTLDGTARQASELAGASGHLVIRLDYENKSSQVSKVGDSKQRLYTPFVCMSVAMMDSKVFPHVEVVNGKVIDDKGSLAVVGYAVPGLRKSLNIDSDKIDLDLPEYVQIEADVSDLALDPIYTIATPELFDELDTDSLNLDDIDELGDNAGKLQDAMDELIGGADSLTDALELLAQGETQLGSGIAALQEALGALPKGTSALAQGAANLEEGLEAAGSAAGEIADGARGLPDLATSADEAVEGAQGDVQTAAGDVDSAQGSVAALQEAIANSGLEAAQTAVADAAAAATDAKTAAETARDELAAATPTITVPAEVEGGLQGAQEALAALEALDTTDMTEEQIAVVEQAKQALAGSAEATAALDGISGAYDPVDLSALDTAIDSLAASGTTLQETGVDVSTIEASAQAAATSLDTAAGSLAGTAESFGTARGLIAALSQASGGVSAGVDGLATSLSGAAEGASALATQLDGLATQAPQLVSGLGALSAGAGQLAAGLSATAQGSGALSAGLSAFNDEGISKIVDTFEELDDDIGDAKDRVDALRKAARAYNNFSGKADGATSSVRFIYKTEQIG